MFMRAWACVVLSDWRVNNYCQDNTRKYLGPVVYRKRVPKAGKQLAGSPGCRSHQVGEIYSDISRSRRLGDRPAGQYFILSTRGSRSGR